MKALYEGATSAVGGRPLAARIFSGTSVGAYNAAFLAQEEDPGLDSVQRLEAIWRDRIADTTGSCGNGVFRLRADPFQILDPGCLSHPMQLLANFGRDALFWSGYAAVYGGQFLTSDASFQVRATELFNLSALFSLEPLERLLAETIDLSRLSATPNSLAVVVSDWQNAKAKVYPKDEVIRLGTDTLKASTAIPGFFPPVLVEGIPYVDGGLLMNTPTKPAIDQGADVLYVIYVDPKTAEIPLPWQEGVLPNTADSLYRIYTILLSTQMNDDMLVLATINEELASLEAGAAAQGSALPAVRARRRWKPGAAAAAPAAKAAEKLYRPVVVHRYRPKHDLGGIQSFLDFDLPKIEWLIGQGYEDAVNHDCGEQDCILLPGGSSPSSLGSSG